MHTQVGRGGGWRRQLLAVGAVTSLALLAACSNGSSTSGGAKSTGSAAALTGDCAQYQAYAEIGRAHV